MKVKIIVDSSCGLTKNEAHDLGWDFLPIQAEVDGKIYQIGVDLDINKYSEIWTANRKIDAFTFATPPGVVEQVVSQYTEEYDKVLIYPISTVLSSQNSAIMTLFKDNPKVHVVESKKINYLIVRDLLLFEEKIANGAKFEAAIKHFAENNERLLLVSQFNDALVKGGRLSKAAAVIAKLAKIVPIIRFDNGVLEKDGIGRIFSKTLEKLVKELYENLDKNNEDYYLTVIHANNQDLEKLINSFRAVTDNYPRIVSFKLPADIAVHTGVGAVCVTFAKIDPAIKDKMFKNAKIW
ncbi:DegV family protein [Metamycoplasma neophronis]|uniref:DegV family EDD domain-containing protein n=1 Tax=Metamycoplasma neophronis TaxID=872983 RepID=A0ABY2Z011_9BACT|nr:DegV family protein [Metamycoplasma neophronis]TPR53380.1 DegV family EDD domain-containing protein [Metamycoplasma neophronis]